MAEWADDEQGDENEAGGHQSGWNEEEPKQVAAWVHG
jgi:hypothetical protein